MKGSYLGPKFNTNETKTILDNLSSNYELLDEKEILDKTSEELINGKVIGWFQGKTEFGPRALGNRSILADPRNLEMQKLLNLKTKFREGFRPFAPAVIESEVNNWFEYEGRKPLHAHGW